MSKFILLPAILTASWILAGSPDSESLAQVTTGNLLDSPGGEAGDGPWELDPVGPTLLLNSPIVLANEVQLGATEGDHWFGADVNYSQPAGSLPILFANTVSIEQIVDLTELGNVRQATVGLDSSGAGETLLGDGSPRIRPLVVLKFLGPDSNLPLAVEFVGFGPEGQAVAFDLGGETFVMDDLRQTVALTPPKGATRLAAEFRTETGMSSTTVDSEVRVVAGIDDTTLSLIHTLQTADFNGDGDVDGEDFLAWQSNFGTVSGATALQGDTDGDGDVDGDDFLTWQTQFSGDSAGINQPRSGNEIPEPATWLLGAAALAVAGTMRCVGFPPRSLYGASSKPLGLEAHRTWIG